jgi:hypothetical protein
MRLVGYLLAQRSVAATTARQKAGGEYGHSLSCHARLFALERKRLRAPTPWQPACQAGDMNCYSWVCCM